LTMARDASQSLPQNAGTLRLTANGYSAQFSIAPKQRKGTLLRTCTTEDEAKRRQLAIAKLIARLRETGHGAVIPTTIKEPGLPSPKTGRRADITVEQLAKLWTSGELAEQYPDHVRVKRSSDTDAAMLTWLGKVRLPDGTTFGARAVAAVTLDDCDHVMGALPKTAQSPSSRRQYAQALRKLLVYAVY